MIRAQDTDTSAAVIAALTSGWAPARRDQPTCPAAAPLVTRVWLTSHIVGLQSASSQYPCAAANADRNRARAAVLTASPRSRPRRHRLCTAAGSPVGSAAAR